MIPYDKRDGKRERERKKMKRRSFSSKARRRKPTTRRGSWNDDVLILLRVNKV